MLFVCYPKCSTCKKAEAWLTEHGAAFQKRDIKEDNPHPGGAGPVAGRQRPAGEAVFQHQRSAVQGPGAERPAARHDRGGTAGPAGHRRYAGKAPHPGGRGHRAGGLQRGGMGGARPLKGGGRLRLAGKKPQCRGNGGGDASPVCSLFCSLPAGYQGGTPSGPAIPGQPPPGGGGACAPGEGGGRSRWERPAGEAAKGGELSLSPAFFGKVWAQPTGSQTRIWVRPPVGPGVVGDEADLRLLPLGQARRRTGRRRPSAASPGR